MVDEINTRIEEAFTCSVSSQIEVHFLSLSLTPEIRSQMFPAIYSLRHLQRADPFRCPFRSDFVCLGRAADIKMRPVRIGRGATKRADTFIAHLAGMHVPTAEARRPAQNSGRAHCCR
jgi:hypothetical protein